MGGGYKSASSSPVGVRLRLAFGVVSALVASCVVAAPVPVERVRELAGGIASSVQVSFASGGCVTPGAHGHGRRCRTPDATSASFPHPVSSQDSVVSWNSPSSGGTGLSRPQPEDVSLPGFDLGHAPRVVRRRYCDRTGGDGAVRFRIKVQELSKPADSYLVPFNRRKGLPGKQG